MEKYIKIFLVTSGFFLALSTVVLAINPFDISYPIPELGSCNSQEECKTYCDSPANRTACINFAQNNGMIPPEDARDMKKANRVLEKEFSGPNGCSSREECDRFCQNPDNAKKCLAFSVKEGFMTQAEADRILERADRGGPGGCNSREECDRFCQNPDNNRVCLEFVVKEGRITAEEAEFLIKQASSHRQGGPRPGEPKIDEEKVEQLLQKTGGPGGCSNMKECDAFCSDFNNSDICMAFAEKHELMSAEEIKRMKKFADMPGPGGCRGQKECDAFCSIESNRDECFRFTIENGMLPPEEVEKMKREMEIVRKLDRGFSGPGGCQGPEECDAFCRDPNHLEECIKFSQEQGFIDKGRADQMMDRQREFEQRRKGEDGNFFDFGPPPGDFKHNGPPPGEFDNYGPPPGDYDKHPEYMPPQPTNYPPRPEGDNSYPAEFKLYGPPPGELDNYNPPPGDYDKHPEYMPPQPTNYPPPPEGYDQYQKEPMMYPGPADGVIMHPEPDGYMPPPGDFDYPQPNQYPTNEFMPPEPPEEKPLGSGNLKVFLGTILQVFLGL